MRFQQRNEEKIEKSVIMNLCKELNISTITSEILCKRGYSDVDDALEYMGLKEMEFSSPFDIATMELASNRINEAINNDEKIVIFSDYDADGVCGCSIYLRKLRSVGAINYTYYTPERESEGYGMNMKAIEKLADMNADLIITVDCGISNTAEVEYAISLGMDVIVTDHHSCPEVLPDCICIDPKLGSRGGQENLCGAAVAMKVCQAFGGGGSFNEGMELAAIATIADMMPLVGENRHIVNKGLEIINSTPSKEIKALLDACNKKETIDSGDIAYTVAPVINAAGRVATAHLCIDLLSGISKDPLASAIAMVDFNKERKKIEREVYKSAIKMIENIDLSKRISIVLHSEDWPLGVVGIAASKLMNTFSRPVILLGSSDGKIKGSCRSVDGINIFDILSNMPEMFEKFGGHSKAAGLTLADGKLEEFSELFEIEIQKYDKILFEYLSLYDVKIECYLLDVELITQINLMQPFGQGNPQVKLLLENLFVKDYRLIGSDKNHYMATLDDGKGEIKCNGFFSKLPQGTVDGTMTLDTIVTAQINQWKGYTSARALVDVANTYFVDEAAYNENVSSNDMLFNNYAVKTLLEYDCNSDFQCILSNMDDLRLALDSNDKGVLIIVGDSYIAKLLLDELGMNTIQSLEIMQEKINNDVYGSNTLLFAPNIESINSKWYSKIYHIAPYENYGKIEDISKRLQGEQHLVIMKNYNEIVNNISKFRITKDRLRQIYTVIRDEANAGALKLLIQRPASYKIYKWELSIAIEIFQECGLVKRIRNMPYLLVYSKMTMKLEDTRGYNIFNDPIKYLDNILYKNKT